ncbi:MAG: T9SS type A sorting domain-containing protein [Bacteroidia bacterium]|nr:T9SS type A sorting domain-containing protein [Bacteroidia bacterium]
MKKIISFLFSSASLCAFAQYTNVMVSNTNSPEEVSICINPKNTNQIVAGANLNNVYYSIDAGLTWNINQLTEPFTGVWGDPIIFTDTSGDFYYSHLSNPSSGSWIDRIVFQKSTDGGQTWGTGTWTGLNGGKAEDKEGVAVNPVTNEIYVTWTEFDNYGTANPADSSRILFSKSADAGQTWSTPVRLNKISGDCVDSDNTVEGAVPCVGPAGEIYVAWTGPNGIVFNKSLDGGLTWLPQETSVTATPGGWDYNISGLQRCNGLPQTICDLSGGANNGTIYINWSDQRNGSTDTDVWLIKSTDGGTTWSTPARVNDDAPGKQNFMTWMNYDKTNGNLYFVFYDRRNFSSGQQTDLYMARSTDGGNSFTNFKINQNSFTPSSSIFFGDYISISVHNNVVRPIWMQMSGGALSVWTAIVDGATIGTNEFSLDKKPIVELNQNFPNPFSQTTWIKFSLKKAAKVNLCVYDAFGKKVATLLENEEYKKGDFDYIFNASSANLQAGIYYYTLSADENRVTKKMVLY